jgi:hypothetical protein
MEEVEQVVYCKG